MAPFLRSCGTSYCCWLSSYTIYEYLAVDNPSEPKGLTKSVLPRPNPPQKEKTYASNKNTPPIWEWLPGLSIPPIKIVILLTHHYICQTAYQHVPGLTNQNVVNMRGVYLLLYPHSNRYPLVN